MRKGSIDCFSCLAAEISEACILKWKNKSKVKYFPVYYQGYVKCTLGK